MTASGFRVRITSLVFAFKSASLVLNQDPAYIRKPKKSTFDQSIKFLHWLFWSFQIVSGRFRWFQVIFRSFQVALYRFRSFQLVPHFSMYLLYAHLQIMQAVFRLFHIEQAAGIIIFMLLKMIYTQKQKYQILIRLMFAIIYLLK